MPAVAYFAGYDPGRGHFPGRGHHDQHPVQPCTLLPEAPRVLCEQVQSMTLPQVCSVNHEQDLWMTDFYSDCKRSMTPEGVMAAVRASRNETGWVYVRRMHDGRN